MKTALLGHTGFVGSTLLRQTSFTDTYNSKNISQIQGKEYDLVVCAAAPGTKWLANKNPEADWESISRLIATIGKAVVKEFVLISTIDVYPNPSLVDETTLPDTEHSAPYGKHRRMLEKHIIATFPKHTIVRLPALFGEGLKKNIVYDFIKNNQVEKINPKGQFQFYNMNRLWEDIQTARKAGILCINIVNEPVGAGEIYSAAFGMPLNTGSDMPYASYDVRSIHADLYGGVHYFAGKQKVLQELTAFISNQRSVI